MGDNNELTLYRKSNVYLEKDAVVTSFPLETYHRNGERNVPYVSLKKFLPLVKLIDPGYSTVEPRLDYSKENGIYTIHYPSNKEN